jgi:ADP-ribosyl-[dinitrogen reductase] hydrolase
VTTIGDRIAGGLLGVAAGDALGVTLEFSPPQAPVSHAHREISGGGPFGFEPGEGSDDTDLTWAVTAAVVDTARDPATTVKAAAERMLAWLEGNPRDVGNTTRAALRSYRSTGRLDAGALVMGEWSAGNGSLMRALPTGLARTDPAGRAAEARALSAVTHADPRCTDSCVAYCDLAAALLDGARAADAVDDVVRSPRMRCDVRRAVSFGATAALADLRPTGYVLDTLAVAAWAICQPTNLEDTLVAIVNLGGDADTTGAVAGGLLGVRDGATAIPDRWLDTLDYTPQLTAAARSIHAIRDRTRS